jgi:hypothetical protein
MASTRNRAPRRVGDVADCLQIAAAAVREGDPAHGDEPRAIVAVVGQLVVVDAAVGGGDEASLHAAVGEVHPGVEVRRVFVGQGDDVVAGAPIEAFGDVVDAGGGVGDEGDFIRVGVDMVRGGLARFVEQAGPFGPGGVAFDQRLLGLQVHRGGGGGGDWRDGGVVEVGPLFGDRHLLAECAPSGFNV